MNIFNKNQEKVDALQEQLKEAVKTAATQDKIIQLNKRITTLEEEQSKENSRLEYYEQIEQRLQKYSTQIEERLKKIENILQDYDEQP